MFTEAIIIIEYLVWLLKRVKLNNKDANRLDKSLICCVCLCVCRQQGLSEILLNITRFLVI